MAWQGSKATTIADLQNQITRAKAELKYYQGFSDPRCAREAQHCKKVVKRLESELKRYI